MTPSRAFPETATADTTGITVVADRPDHAVYAAGGLVYLDGANMNALVGIAAPEACGSMAHELVHLTIRSSFPMSPPWLEEGLASAVALAASARCADA